MFISLCESMSVQIRHAYWKGPCLCPHLLQETGREWSHAACRFRPLAEESRIKMNTFLYRALISPGTPTRTMPSRLPVMMAWLASHAGPSAMQQQVMAPSGPQAVVMLARGCPLTFHRDRWAPAQETMVPCAGRPGFTPSGVTAWPQPPAQPLDQPLSLCTRHPQPTVF